MSEATERTRGGLIDHIHGRIREEILHQRLRPGVKLAAEHLATMLEVSRTPVRQALERLAQEGYVTRIPARGFFVAEIGLGEVQDLYDVRRALETHAMNTAFARGVAREDIERITAVDDAYQRLVQDETVLSRSDADQNLHLAMAELSGNQVLTRMLRDVFERLNFRRRYDGYWYWGARGTRSTEGAAEHRRILAAVARGNRDDAIGELCGHLDRAWHNYERFLHTSAQMNVPRRD